MVIWSPMVGDVFAIYGIKDNFMMNGNLVRLWMELALPNFFTIHCKLQFIRAILWVREVSMMMNFVPPDMCGDYSYSNNLKFSGTGNSSFGRWSWRVCCCRSKLNPCSSAIWIYYMFKNNNVESAGLSPKCLTSTGIKPGSRARDATRTLVWIFV